jgi:hypothetical protein
MDGHTMESVPPVLFPEAARQRGSREMAHVGRVHVPLWLDGATAVLGRRGDRAGFTFEGAAMGVETPADFGLIEQTGFAYTGDRAALQIVTTDIAGRESKGLLYPFRADGAALDEPTRVPTQLDLPASPRACGPADAATPRVVVPYQPGSRRALLVSDAVEPMRTLLTGDAVLHGTAEAPCVAAYDAVLVTSELSGAVSAEQAIVPMATPERAFLFRLADKLRDAASALEYRTMSCRVDPSAEVPPEVFRERGTLAEPR